MFNGKKYLKKKLDSIDRHICKRQDMYGKKTLFLILIWVEYSLSPWKRRSSTGFYKTSLKRGNLNDLILIENFPQAFKDCLYRASLDKRTSASVMAEELAHMFYGNKYFQIFL